MKTLISGRHFTVSPSLRASIEKKADKAQEFLPAVNRAHVILSVEKYRHTAEAIISGRGTKVRATGTTKDMYASVDLVMDKVYAQLKKMKAKKIQSKHGKAPWPAPLEEEARPSAALSIQRLHAPNLSLKEAVSRLNQLKQDYIFFNNTSTDVINLLYRSEKGGLSLIQPQTAPVA